MIIEFKRTYPNRNAKASLDEAIEQMKTKLYGIDPFGKRVLYRVAMVISTEDKKILPDYCLEIK